MGAKITTWIVVRGSRAAQRVTEKVQNGRENYNLDCGARLARGASVSRFVARVGRCTCMQVERPFCLNFQS